MTCAVARAGDSAGASFERFSRDVRPLLAKYCFNCHGDKKQEGELSLANLRDAASVGKATKTWEKVYDRLLDGEMPPEGKPHPTEDEMKRLRAWLSARVDGDSPRDPGRVTIRRLNRAEYNNTIRDLVGVDFKPADDFPSDDVGEGFDNIGDVLSLPPLLLEKYLTAAENVMNAAIVTEPPKPPSRQVIGRKLKGDAQGGKAGDRGRKLSSNGELYTEFDLPQGDYSLRVRAYGEQAGDEPVKMTVKLDGKDLHTFDVKAVEANPITYTQQFKIEAAKSHKIAVAFINDYYKEDDPNPNNRDRNLVVIQVDVDGPSGADARVFPPSHAKLISLTPKPDGSDKDECARTIILNFASHAFRRVATPEEVQRLLQLYRNSQKSGERFEQSIQVALQAVLVSPYFLFRIEADPAGNEPRRLNDFELATRISYFLWSSLPDAELFKVAARNRLHEPEMLTQQVLRMMKDPKSRALVENFGAQWLQIRNLQTVTPARSVFAAFDDRLRADMRTETEMFFDYVVREDRSILDFIDGNYSFLNDRLAKHYGIPKVSGKEFRKVDFSDGRRAGILTQGSILTITSNPTRTSPVKRGKWIMETILGTPPPPPPANVPDLKEGKEVEKSAPLRVRLEQHRADAICASCHSRMDPLGFGLENFDAIGQWRTKDGSFDIDPTGTLPSGKSFQGPAELRGILKENQDGFCRCLSQKMLTYALGRGLTRSDRVFLDEITKQVAEHDYRMSSLVLAIINSDPFQFRGVKRGAK